MKPIRFKVLDVQEGERGSWIVVGHSMEAGVFQTGPRPRLAGCKVELIPPPKEMTTAVPADRFLSVFRLLTPGDHERFERGQKVLLDL